MWWRASPPCCRHRIAGTAAEGGVMGAGDILTGHGEFLDANRAHWDELVAIHVASSGPDGYDVDALRRGERRLHAIEEAELGPVAGLDVLHLQCHFGVDRLLLAPRGAWGSGLENGRGEGGERGGK